MACQISVLTGSRAGGSFSFSQPTIHLGRDPRCELSFDPNIDLTVSGQHATISFVNGAYQLIDSSTNGTTINGVPIQRGQPVALAHGTTLELGAGGPQIRFSIVTQATPGASAPAPAAPAHPTNLPPVVSNHDPRLPLTGQSPPPRSTQPPATQPAAPVQAQMVSEVSISVEKPPGDQPLEFKGQLVRIGRDPSADVAFDPNRDLLVSFNHAKIV
ncbi:MAG: FHA domain-containing protein, partial [Deltaproteobacteria bacterium]|nr:FHA domain-containing protein [Deltaproteobacteria bacterium]